ncbi:hypothetical protein F5Y05DRAFT_423433 [Hypoxylon sp. FL0543]|nr:hypothetical protein F5Y05DRAFT_423433 [Hypoxylon sp. FL0543]
MDPFDPWSVPIAPDNAILRNSSAPELARYFQELLKQTSGTELAAHVAIAIASGAVPPTVVHVFLSVCKEPDAIAYALVQKTSIVARRIAINHFIRKCRSEHFLAMWNAVDRLRGMLALMSTMSVHEINLLCRGIGKCTPTKGPVRIRQRCFSELFEMLNNTGSESLDGRPLRSYYNKILPACLPVTVLHEASRSTKFRCIIDRAHIYDYQSGLDAKFFPPKSAAQSITPYKFVLESSAIGFRMMFLRRLSMTPSYLKGNAKNLIEDLVRPLARHFSGLRTGHCHDLQVDLYGLLAKCIAMERGIATNLDYALISYAIKAWGSARGTRDSMEDLIKTLLSFMPQRYRYTLRRIATELRHVRPALRFSLLRLLLQNARPFEVDISNTCSEELRSLGDAWPPRLFYVLPSGDSLGLFQLLWEANPHGKFIAADEPSNLEAVMRDANYRAEKFGDPYIFSALLHVRDNDRNSSNTWFSEVNAVLQERKSKAMSMQNAEDKANWVQSAALLSIASGSLQIYEETILWARQFKGDPLIVNRLFSSDTLFSRESLDLLSGIPQRITDGIFSLARLERNIEQANRMVIHYVEMIATQCSEPHFDMSDINQLSNIQHLPSRIIWRRAQLLDALQEGAGLTNDEIYNAVWKQSIDMLLGFERFNLEDDHRRLCFNVLKGPLMGQQSTDSPKAHLAKFLDELGKSRDGLWQEYRSRRCPELANIGAPWPRGLPIQYLTPTLPSAWKNMPYLESRARAILFAPRATLLAPPPTDNGTKAVIGPFLDSFVFALRVFILAANQGPERDERIQQVWDHSLTQLTCESQFKISNFELPAQHISPGPIEWNPSQVSGNFQTTPHIIRHSEKFPESCLECMLRAEKVQGSLCLDTVSRYSWTSKPEIILAGTTQAIWDFGGSLKELTPSTRDALVAAAIEILNSKYGIDSSLFILPFPSPSDIRFPSLYLGNEFIEGEGNSITSDPAIRILDRFSSSVPPQLLQRLTRSMWERLDRDKTSTQEAFLAFTKIIRRLALGDSPQAACEFIKEAVLKYQNEELSHNYLLDTAFLSHFRPDHMVDMSHSLAYAIKNKLRLQQRARKLREMRNQPPEPPRIKVTTVELVARLLCQTKHVDSASVLEPLVQLFLNSPHADMQVAIVQSLLRIQSESSHEDIQSDIIRILEEHVVPIVASVNERRPPTETEWIKAWTREGPLPDVYESSPTSDLPPIIRLLVDAIPTLPTAKDSIGQPSRGLWMDKIIRPIVNGSTKNHRRWTTLFLELNGFDLNVKYLPPIPVNPRLLIDIFCKCPEYLHDATFDAIKEVVEINTRPESTVSTINEAVRGTFLLRDSNARKHWLSVWNITESPLSLGIPQLARLLFDKTMISAEEPLGGATIRGVQLFLMEIADTYLSTSNVHGFNAFMEELDFPGRICSLETHAFFKSNCLPLLKGLVVRIDSLRTSNRQQGPNPTVSKFPDTWPIKLQILKGEHWKQSSERLSADDIRDFVRDVTSLIQQLASDQEPGYQRWVSLKQMTLKQFHTRDSYSLALEMGSIEELKTPDRSFVDHLRFQLATELLSEAGFIDDEEAIFQVRSFCLRWIEDPNEFIRTTTRSLMRKLYDNVEELEDTALWVDG